MVEPAENVDNVAHEVIGAAIEVHRHLGPGYLENVYEEALAEEFRLRQIPHERQWPFNVDYKTKSAGTGRIDFLVHEVLVVELKSVDKFAPVHLAQVLSYLKATRLHLGLLLNFNVVTLKQGIKRMVYYPKGS